LARAETKPNGDCLAGPDVEHVSSPVGWERVFDDLSQLVGWHAGLTVSEARLAASRQKKPYGSRGKGNPSL
jgi:hypothetical protein